MTNAQQGAVEAGQAVYSPTVLSVYDIVVLGISNRWLWRCPTPGLIDLYNRNIKARHLDIGVGTGYFLDHATWPVSRPDITLLDLNSNSLAAAARRIVPLRAQDCRRGCAEAAAPAGRCAPFQSVGLCYLLHCLPGSIPEKAAVFDHIKPFVASGTRVFGATILQGDALREAGPPSGSWTSTTPRASSRTAATLPADLEAALRCPLHQRHADDERRRRRVRGRGGLAASLPTPATVYYVFYRRRRARTIATLSAAKGAIPPTRGGTATRRCCVKITVGDVMKRISRAGSRRSDRLRRHRGHGRGTSRRRIRLLQGHGFEPQHPRPAL